MNDRPSTRPGPAAARGPAIVAEPPPHAIVAPPARLARAALHRRDEAACMRALLPGARVSPERLGAARAQARDWIEALREERASAGGVDALMREFSLGSEEGIALMCLAEALLRIPDRPTALALIRDKIGGGDWRGHLGASQSLFVNAAAWGLMITGRLVGTHREAALGSALSRLIARGGEPLVLAGLDVAMKMLGQQFVLGQTIGEALGRAAPRARRGYTHSYDMLGEAALTAQDADRYTIAYGDAIDAIGRAADGRGPLLGPGVSIKLSALHPRYHRAHRERVLAELLPRLMRLARKARAHDIGFTIDAEESERLELSLELIAAVALDGQTAGWDGLGVAVQAYGKRAPAVIDALADLARSAGRRLMVRLVKGAYWDSEIKRAQAEGQAGYPVYTRKVHTDVAYLACARRMLAESAVFYPQFATHNAMTAALVAEMADEAGVQVWEYQCLHGMGESLYDRLVGEGGRACRIYAPVGSHHMLLAYLVRRLLENGANASFVHQIVDPSVPVDRLLDDPVERVERDTFGQPHPSIVLPRDLYAAVPGGARANAAGADLNDEPTLAGLDATFAACAQRDWHAAPMLAVMPTPAEAIIATHARSAARPVTAPADRRRVVGHVVESDPDAVDTAIAAAEAGARAWAERPDALRAAVLDRAADLMERERDTLMWLAVHEAGKTLGNALGEVREAVDFCRYYASQLRAGALPDGTAPLGPVACISPWNFPLAIFVGQVAAALAAGNVVLAKPAEQTPLIAARAVQLLHEAGVPVAALQLLPGDGQVGAQLVRDRRIRGVVFTGSTDVARAIDRSLAERPEALPIPLVAETGGQNALIVDSSALPEQVVADALVSAFDSAGQRCSALRVLCLQEEVADGMLAMLRGALAELRVGDPARLDTDVGPVIDEEARARLQRHVDELAARCPVAQALPPQDGPHGTFVVPTVAEIPSLDALPGEVFGPVLHVLRWRRDALDALVDRLNATGYGLTLGIASRIDETIDAIVARARVGNVYVNRTQIGAVVGVQPFGGERLSGTGPKAGGPLYLPRLRQGMPAVTPGALAGHLGVHDGSSAAADGAAIDAPRPREALAALAALAGWATAHGNAALAAACTRFARDSLVGRALTLPGPTGETNTLSFVPRGRVLCARVRPDDDRRWLLAAAAFATGNRVAFAARELVPATAPMVLPDALPPDVLACVDPVVDGLDAVDAVLVDRADAVADPAVHGAWRQTLAQRPGARVRVVVADTTREMADADTVRPAVLPLHELVIERTLTVNITAAGGNAALMTLAPH